MSISSSKQHIIPFKITDERKTLVEVLHIRIFIYLYSPVHAGQLGPPASRNQDVTTLKDV